MRTRNIASLVLAGLAMLWAPVVPGDARAQEKPEVQVQIPQPGVQRNKAGARMQPALLFPVAA